MGGGKNRRQRGPRQLSSTVRLDRRTIWTENAVPGAAVYGESLRRFSGAEHRRWDPSRSKLGAGMLRTKRDPSELLPDHGDTVLYLGAGHGTSVSHLYDHVCGASNRFSGRLVAVDLAPRCLRDLTFLGRGTTGVGSGAGRCPPARRLGRSFAQTSAVAVSRRGASGSG